MADNTKSQRVRLEEQMGPGWIAEIVDYATSPASVVPGSRRFVETSQVASLFVNSFGRNTGVTESPIGLSAYAESPAKGVYLYVEPAKIRPLNLYREGPGKKEAISAWIPSSAWIFSADHERTNKWANTVRMGMVMPNELGLFTPSCRVMWYPMSNTYQDFRICWGNVRPPAYAFPQQIRKAIDVFFASDFNGHVWGEQEDFFTYIKKFSTKEVLKDMADADRWKLLRDSLPRLGNGISLTEFWKRCSGAEGDTDDFNDVENPDEDEQDD